MEMIAGLQYKAFATFNQEELCPALEEDKPFLLLLIVDTAGLAGGSNSFHPDPPGSEEPVHLFTLTVEAEVPEEIVNDHRLCPLSPSSLSG